jgi:hypothetical protein
MTNESFWHDVMKTFQALPIKMKIIWLLAPPMSVLVIIAYVASVTEKYVQPQADLAS